MRHSRIKTSRVRDRRAARLALCALLAGLAVHTLAVCTRFGQQVENELTKLAYANVDIHHPGFSGEGFIVPIISPQNVAIAGGLLIALVLVFRRVDFALWSLLTLVGSCATAAVLKSALPRPLMDPTFTHGLHNSAPSGHVTAATALALTGLAVAPSKLRAIAAVAGTGIATLSAYFVQSSSWHRPSDVLIAVAITLFWAFVGQALIFSPASQSDRTAWNSVELFTICISVICAAGSIWWAAGHHDPPGWISVASALAPCAGVAAITLYGPRMRPSRESLGLHRRQRTV